MARSPQCAGFEPVALCFHEVLYLIVPGVLTDISTITFTPFHWTQLLCASARGWQLIYTGKHWTVAQTLCQLESRQQRCTCDSQ